MTATIVTMHGGLVMNGGSDNLSSSNNRKGVVTLIERLEIEHTQIASIVQRYEDRPKMK